jgi:hypothetical protein
MENDTSALPSVREQREMTAEINERIHKRGDCVWTVDPYMTDCTFVGCGGARVVRPSKNWNHCPYCGGKLVTK